MFYTPETNTVSQLYFDKKRIFIMFPLQRQDKSLIYQQKIKILLSFNHDFNHFGFLYYLPT